MSPGRDASNAGPSEFEFVPRYLFRSAPCTCRDGRSKACSLPSSQALCFCKVRQTSRCRASYSALLLLTAHPDDECMFFVPTVLALAPQHFSVCPSTGDADGLGKIRTRELDDSLRILGIEKNRSVVLDHPEFRDDMRLTWDAPAIAHVVRPFVAQNGIDTILTFDDLGVSRHPNHASLVHGTRLVPNTRVAVLKTIPTLPLKYSGFLVPAALKLGFGRLLELALRPMSHFLGSRTLFAARPQFGEAADRYYVARWTQYLQGVQAMQAHKSQMVWFRWLYISTSQLAMHGLISNGHVPDESCSPTMFSATLTSGHELEPKLVGRTICVPDGPVLNKGVAIKFPKDECVVFRVGLLASNNHIAM